MGRLQDKTTVITEACGGIGSFISRRFAEEGSNVAICDIAIDRAEAQAARINEMGGSAISVDLDVASEESWQAAVQSIVVRFGQINNLVNNAGINDRGTIMSTSIKNWERTFSVNLTGALLGMRAVAPAMRLNGGGSIVNICSLASHHGEVFAAYGASKWGLRGLTKIAAMELVDWNIRVNSVSPAVVETELNAGQPYLRPMAALTPMGRNGTGLEIANAVLFLSSDEASFITGQDLAADGGFTAGAAAKFAHKLAQNAESGERINRAALP
jgi:3alpha(or 20beta)-hydroxysteroid dehydrogenase